MILFDACKIRLWGKARNGAVTIDIGFIGIGPICGSLFLFTTDVYAGGLGRWYYRGKFYFDIFYIRGLYHSVRDWIKYRKQPKLTTIIIDE